MDFDESKDVVENTYAKMKKHADKEFIEDPFYQYFYNLLDTGMNYYDFTNVRLIKSIDEDWIAAIEEALPCIHEVIQNPRKFIDEDREVVNIAMARNITTESIRHLTQHSDLIDKYDEDGTVIPNRILNVFKEESYNIYENRFICTLMAELQHFVNKRYNVIFENSKDELGSFFAMESRIEHYTETIDYKFQIKIRDKQTDLSNENENENIFSRLVKVHRQVNGLASTEFIMKMRSYPSVRHPIVKTNAIGKNFNYKACHKLWNFIYTYDKIGYQVNLIKQEPIISKQLEQDIYHSFIFNYAMVHNQVERDNELNINQQKKEKEIDIKYIRQALDEIVRGSDIPEDNLKKIIMNELSTLQAKRKSEKLEFERVRKKKSRKKK